MGRIFTLSGPSGVGKTTFLNELFKYTSININILPRYTDRPIREGEIEGFEHYFCSHQGFLQKVFSNDFIHVEKWGNYYIGIDSRVIEEQIKKSQDGILLASIFGAARLRATYGINIFPIYMWSGDEPSLLNPRCMDDNSEEILELKWRLNKKISEDGFTDYKINKLKVEEFIRKRMIDNYLDIASVNGRLRARENILFLLIFIIKSI